MAAVEIATDKVTDACEQLQGKGEGLDFVKSATRSSWVTRRVNRPRKRGARRVDVFDIDHRNAQLYDAVFEGYLKLADKQDGGLSITNYEITDLGLEVAHGRCNKHRLDFYDLVEGEDYATLLALVIYDDPMMVEH